MSDKPIKTIATRLVYQNKWSRVREDIIERADGARGIYGVLDKDPACIIIPIEHTPNGDFLTLVHQYRYCVEGSFYEFPQGGWEAGEDVDVAALARGELREETGLSGRMTLLASNWIAYGAMRQRHHVWLADELIQGENALEAEEHGLTVHRVSVDEFERMIFDGRVEDNCTLAAWATYLVWKRQSRT